MLAGSFAPACTPAGPQPASGPAPGSPGISPAEPDRGQPAPAGGAWTGAPGARSPGAATAPPPSPAPDRPNSPSAQPAPSAPSQPNYREPRLAGILAAHNRYRADHCAPPLTWSDEVAASAQRWAETLRDNQCAFDHDPNTRLGENMSFFSPAGSADAEQVVAGWYNEIAQYSFDNPGFRFETGHFTQVVWVASQELGCGLAECRNAELWVCRYRQAGNWRGQFRDNVRRKGC
ncbi:MAG: CAP domain-containing protein [Myxococcota bacterium]